MLFTGSHTSIWRVRAPLLTVLCAKEGTALQERLVRLSPLKGLAATGAVGQETMEAVRAAIGSKRVTWEPKVVRVCKDGCATVLKDCLPRSSG